MEYKQLIVGVFSILLLSACGSGSKTDDNVTKNEGNGTEIVAGLSRLSRQVVVPLYDQVHGKEFWLTDGTSEGTRLIEDLNKKRRSVNAKSPVVVNDKIYFFANDRTHGEELWISDGTEEGTHMLKDIFSGHFSSIGSNWSGISKVGDKIYFRASDGIHGVEPWVSDGTQEGTYLLKDINSVTGAKNSNPRNFTQVEEKVFFSAYDGNGTELWVSDGTAAGTHMVKDINPGSKSAGISSMAVLNNKLYFKADDGRNGTELWVSNGTEAGTHMVKDINPTPKRSGLYSILVFNNKLILNAAVDSYPRSLWISDGTVDGTVALKDRSGNAVVNPGSITVAGGRVYFHAEYGGSQGLYVSDGTQTGTYMIREITPCQDYWHKSYGFEAVGEKVFFGTCDNRYGRELWVTDGTDRGTHIVKDINPDQNSSSPSYITAMGGKVYFKAFEPEHGAQLWVSDGTAKGTYMLKELEKRKGGASNFHIIIEFRDKLYFAATGALWRSDGTEEGTNKVIDPEIGTYDSYNFTTKYISVHDQAYVVGLDDKGKGRGLFTHNSTDEGFENLIYTSSIPYVNNNFTDLKSIGEKIYFVALDKDAGRELMVSNGTKEGTHVVKDILEGTDGSNPYSLTSFKEKLYFKARNSEGYGLWKSDGTEEGTTEVYHAEDKKYINNLVATKQKLYFSLGTNYNSPIEFFESNGSKKSTQKLEIDDSNASFVRKNTFCIASESKLFVITRPSSENKGYIGKIFVYEEGNNKFKEEVMDMEKEGYLETNQTSSYISILTQNDTLYFRLTFPEKSELWRSDGSKDGTWRIKIIKKCHNSSIFRKKLRDKFFFITFNDVALSNEDRAIIWVSDGTESGTIRLPLHADYAQVLDIVDNNALIRVSTKTSQLLYRTDGTIKGTKLIKRSEW